MRAVILKSFEAPLEVEEVEQLEIGSRDVRVTIDASGLCHSDLTVATGGFSLPLPIVLGHEGAGTVTAVGSAASHLRIGDRVVIALKPQCGVCWFCSRGQTHLCELASETVMRPRVRLGDGQSIPAMSNIGSLAESTTVDFARVIKVETDLPAAQLALLGCGVTTGVCSALNTAAVEPGSTVAVIGCGGVGQGVIQGARIAGATRIIAIDPIEMKRDVARALGATDAIDPNALDPIEGVRDLTQGRGADYGFEVIGVSATVRQAFDLTRRGGTVVIVGMARGAEEFSLPGFRMMGEAKRVLGSYYGSAQVRRDIPRLVEFAESGRLDLGSMVTRTLSLSQVNEGLAAMGDGGVIRSVIIPAA